MHVYAVYNSVTFQISIRYKAEIFDGFSSLQKKQFFKSLKQPIFEVIIILRHEKISNI